MSTSKRFVFFAALLAFVVPASAMADAKSQIEARAKEWAEKYNAGDAAGVAALYEEDGQILPPQTDAVAGRAKIQEYWQGVMGAGVKTAALQLLEVHSSGDIAAEVGSYVMKNAEDQNVDQGKYMVLWKKKKGSWVIVRDIWNSSMSPATAPAK
jgi:uncharacterized protein (TIGR02246 family)